MKIVTTACAALLCAAAAADSEFTVGRWKVSFADKNEKLVLAHADGKASVEGFMVFQGPASVTGAGVGKDATTADWRVASSRDGVPNRLALVDTRDNVNGYITFQANGDEISMLVYHRTAFAYDGRLAYRAAVRFRDDAYACSLTPKASDRVLSMKSGPVFTADDDALYSPSTDEALQLSGGAFLVDPDASRIYVSSLDIADSAKS